MVNVHSSRETAASSATAAQRASTRRLRRLRRRRDDLLCTTAAETRVFRPLSNSIQLLHSAMYEARPSTYTSQISHTEVVSNCDVAFTYFTHACRIQVSHSQATMLWTWIGPGARRVAKRGTFSATPHSIIGTDDSVDAGSGSEQSSTFHPRVKFLLRAYATGFFYPFADVDVLTRLLERNAIVLTVCSSPRAGDDAWCVMRNGAGLKCRRISIHLNGSFSVGKLFFDECTQIATRPMRSVDATVHKNFLDLLTHILCVRIPTSSSSSGTDATESIAPTFKRIRQLGFGATGDVHLVARVNTRQGGEYVTPTTTTVTTATRDDGRATLYALKCIVYAGSSVVGGHKHQLIPGRVGIWQEIDTLTHLAKKYDDAAMTGGDTATTRGDLSRMISPRLHAYHVPAHRVSRSMRRLAPPCGDTHALLLMSLAPGEELFSWIYATHTQLHPWKLIVELLVALARAMDQMHDMGVVHMDIKRENAYIDIRRKVDGAYDIHASFVDFGMAIILPELSTNDEMNTRPIAHWPDALVGTENHQSPEILELRKMNRYELLSSDVYSLGKTFLHILSSVHLEMPSQNTALYTDVSNVLLDIRAFIHARMLVYSNRCTSKEALDELEEIVSRVQSR